MHCLLRCQWKYLTYIWESVITSKVVKFNAGDTSLSNRSDSGMDDDR
jgi:hypothetical protein